MLQNSSNNIATGQTSSGARRGSRWKIPVLGLVVALGVGAGVFAWRESTANKPATDVGKVDTAKKEGKAEGKAGKDGKDNEPPKTLEFAKNDIVAVNAQNLGLIIPVSGSVRPVTQAMVKSKVAGEIAKVHVREGERINAGQPLVTLDTADLKARNDAQRAMVAEARARLDLATKNEANNRSLLAKNFISQTAFDAIANSVQIADANVQSAQAQAAITQRALGDAQIRAPFSGIVSKRPVNVGEKITADAPIAHIVDLSRMELEAPVPVSDIPSVKIGQEIAFKVDGYSDREFKGRVERISPSAEPGSRSISVFVTLQNQDGALKGGMFANGTLAAIGRADVTTVPLAALVEEGGQTFVFALKEGLIERKPVTIGVKSPERGVVEIREGLTIGTEVVTVKADGLKHGAKAIVKAPSGVPALVTPPPKPAKTA
jgi:membrane fusion protein, multidrug efflux system